MIHAMNVSTLYVHRPSEDSSEEEGVDQDTTTCMSCCIVARFSQTCMTTRCIGTLSLTFLSCNSAMLSLLMSTVVIGLNFLYYYYSPFDFSSFPSQPFFSSWPLLFYILGVFGLDLELLLFTVLLVHSYHSCKLGLCLCACMTHSGNVLAVKKFGIFTNIECLGLANG